MTENAFGNPAPAQGAPGGLLRRFFARFIDGVLVNIAAVLLSLLLRDSDYWFLVTGLFSGVLMFGYFVFFEMTRGATPGKSLLGLRVHGPGGADHPDGKQAAIRNAFTLLPVLPFAGGLLMFIAVVVIAVTAFDSPTKQGKHDDLAGGTAVVRN
ncbi:RDD family protein [Mycolicibacillus trivialis]